MKYLILLLFSVSIFAQADDVLYIKNQDLHESTIVLHSRFDKISQNYAIYLARMIVKQITQQKDNQGKITEPGIDFLNHSVNNLIQFRSPINIKMDEKPDPFTLIAAQELIKKIPGFESVDDILQYTDDFIETISFFNKQKQFEKEIQEFVTTLPDADSWNDVIQNPKWLRQTLKNKIGGDPTRLFMKEMIGGFLEVPLEETRMKIDMEGIRYKVKDLDLNIKPSMASTDNKSIILDIDLALNEVEAEVPSLSIQFDTGNFYKRIVIDSIENLSSKNAKYGDLAFCLNNKNIYFFDQNWSSIGNWNSFPEKLQRVIQALYASKDLKEFQNEGKYLISSQEPRDDQGLDYDLFIQVVTGETFIKLKNKWQRLDLDSLTRSMIEKITDLENKVEKRILDYASVNIQKTKVTVAKENTLNLALKIVLSFTDDDHLKIRVLDSSFDIFKNLPVTTLQEYIQTDFSETLASIQGFHGVQIGSIGLPLRQSGFVTAFEERKDFIARLIFKPISKALSDLPLRLKTTGANEYIVPVSKILDLNLGSKEQPGFALNLPLSFKLNHLAFSTNEDQEYFQLGLDLDGEYTNHPTVQKLKQTPLAFEQSNDMIVHKILSGKTDLALSIDQSVLAQLFQTVLKSEFVSQKLPGLIKIGPAGSFFVMDYSENGSLVLDLVIAPQKEKLTKIALGKSQIRFPVIIRPNLKVEMIENTPNLLLSIDDLQLAPFDEDMLKQYGLENDLEDIRFQGLLEKAFKIVEEDLSERLIDDFQPSITRGLIYKILNKILDKKIPQFKIPSIPLSIFKGQYLNNFDLYSDPNGRMNVDIILDQNTEEGKKFMETLPETIENLQESRKK
ncbi:MAG: hypothetical protein H6620_10260 [Halobacteriovoraceae bacterium]|nr:hypothetical protein [Halobacteriovoraceae bacterium]